MVRISAIFIALCMVLIGGSLAAVTYLRFGFTGAESVLVGLAVLTALAVYNAITARIRDRAEATEQISSLSRSSGDLARHLAELGSSVAAMEAKVEQVLERSLATAQPLAQELEELSDLVKHLADTVAAHDAALSSAAAEKAAQAAALASSAAVPAEAAPTAAPPTSVPAPSAQAPSAQAPSAQAPSAQAPSAQAPSAQAPSAPAASAADMAAPPSEAPAVAAVPAAPAIAAFSGLDRDGIIALVRNAIEASRIDLYLQPVVTLPQRKVRYYEAVSRLKTESGDVVAAADFLKYAEAGSLMPKLDHLTVLRCVQVVRRLLLKNRDIGLFCNLSGATLSDASFPQFVEFAEANRAIAPSLVFEFAQSAVRAMGPIEHESLATLAERGFRFSMDNLSDLRIEPRELTESGFRFVKVPAPLLLNRAGAASTDIHPADFSDLLGRFGIDLVAERIENENLVVDLLDYDVRFGQGFLFAPPRPVRAEALRGAGEAVAEPAKSAAVAQPRPASAALAAAAIGDPAETRGALARLARAGASRS